MKIRQIVIFLMILLLGIFLRFSNLSKWSLDIDEIYTIEESANANLKVAKSFFSLNKSKRLNGEHADRFEVLANLISQTYPVYFWGNRIVMRALGTSEFSLRLQSAIWGVLSIIVSFAIAYKYFGFRVAITFATLTVFHPLIQFHSQNARLYSLAYLVSVLIMWCVMQIQTLLRKNESGFADKLKLAFIGFILPLALLVVPLMVFSLTSVAVLIGYVMVKGGVGKFKLSAFFIVPAFIVSIPVGINLVVFTRVRNVLFPDKFDAGEFAGSHLLYKGLSLANNFGVPFIILFILSFWIIYKTRNEIMRVFCISLILNLILYMFWSILEPETRVDYIFVILPVLIFVSSYALVRFLDLCMKQEKNLQNNCLYGCLFFLVAILSPALVSNAFIDGDRLDWRRTARLLMEYDDKTQGEADINIYSTSPGYLSYYIGGGHNRLRPRNLSDFGSGEDSKKGVDSFVVVPLRRAGFDFWGVTRHMKKIILSKSNIIEIIGQDRLDNHVNKLVIFRVRNI